MVTLLKRICKSAWLNFSRDGTLALANIFIIAMVISAITSLFLFQNVSRFVISNIEGKIDISVYFKYETLEEDILQAERELVEIPEIKEVEYVSKEKALESFTEEHKDNPVLMESLEEVGVNPFLACLNVKSFGASQYGAVANFLEKADFKNLIEKIDYHERKPVIERIFSFTSNINKAGIAISAILAIIAILVAFNTVRLAIYNYREEIKIQRLVGASDWFIRGPFLAQGVIVGLFATLACLLIFTIISWGFNSKIEILMPGLNFFGIFIDNFWIILSIQLTAGIGLGIISSLIAIRKYLEA